MRVLHAWSQALSNAQLRRHHSFVGLPPAELLQVTTPETYR